MASEESLKRYGKAAHLLSEMKKVPKVSLAYGQLVMDSLLPLLQRRTPLQPRPAPEVPALVNAPKPKRPRR